VIFRICNNVKHKTRNPFQLFLIVLITAWLDIVFKRNHTNQIKKVKVIDGANSKLLNEYVFSARV